MGNTGQNCVGPSRSSKARRETHPHPEERALLRLDGGVWSRRESSVAKTYATETAVKVTNMAIQLHGSFGLTKEAPLERWARDARMLTLPVGTTQIQQLIIGRELVGLRAFS